MSIWLKYTNDNWNTETVKEIDKFILDRPITTVKKSTGRTMRGVDYSHRMHKKRKRLIIISADFLHSSANKSFMRDFWQAGAVRYSDDNITYYDMTIDKDGDYDPDFIEDDESLEEIEIVLNYKDPD